MALRRLRIRRGHLHPRDTGTGTRTRRVRPRRRSRITDSGFPTLMWSGGQRCSVGDGIGRDVLGRESAVGGWIRPILRTGSASATRPLDALRTDRCHPRGWGAHDLVGTCRRKIHDIATIVVRPRVLSARRAPAWLTSISPATRPAPSAFGSAGGSLRTLGRFIRTGTAGTSVGTLGWGRRWFCLAGLANVGCLLRGGIAVSKESKLRRCLISCGGRDFAPGLVGHCDLLSWGACLWHTRAPVGFERLQPRAAALDPLVGS